MVVFQFTCFMSKIGVFASKFQSIVHGSGFSILLTSWYFLYPWETVGWKWLTKSGKSGKSGIKMRFAELGLVINGGLCFVVSGSDLNEKVSWLFPFLRLEIVLGGHFMVFVSMCFHHPWWLPVHRLTYPLVVCYIAIENGPVKIVRYVSPLITWWFFMVSQPFTRWWIAII